jgi:hypothetical protein
MIYIYSTIIIIVILKILDRGYNPETASVVWWSEFLVTDPEVRVRFPALPDFLRSCGSEKGSTQLREDN